MAYTTINKPTDHFNTLLYVADQTDGRNITGVGFQPDWVWIHNRTQSVNSMIYDAVRGATKDLVSNSTLAEATSTDGLQAFISDGFTHGNGWGNQSTGDNYVAWNWKANGQGSSNTDGSINTTYTSANQTAGFSISKFTVSGSGNVTFGHGLGAKPKVVITKSTSHTTNWNVYHEDTSASPENDYLYLNSSAAKGTATDVWGDGMTTSVVGLGVGIGVSVGRTYVAYCFAEKQGYSKFSSYTGNGNTNGVFIYTGFRPAYVMFKKTTGSAGGWQVWDNKRDPDNPVENAYHPNSNNADGSPDQDIDFVSNGFKLRSNAAHLNANGVVYIYMAFAEAPLVGTNNVPCTAR